MGEWYPLVVPWTTVMSDEMLRTNIWQGSSFGFWGLGFKVLETPGSHLNVVYSERRVSQHLDYTHARVPR